MKFDIPKSQNIIKFIGVGGGGSNAVNHMFRQGIAGVDFAISNTDNQAMESSPVPVRIKLGPNLTEGMGAGSQPQIGKQACLESIEEIKNFLVGAKMLFVTAGMGGGTGTGAAPIIAKAARELDILTVGIVTLPFGFEGTKRNSQGKEGLEELKKNVDTIVIISNEKLRTIFGNLTIRNAFGHADNILTTAAKGIAEIITKTGHVNVDFKDVDTVMRGSGVAVMGTGIGEGENRAYKAIDMAISSPLLEDNDIRGAKHLLINIVSGTKEAEMDELSVITKFIEEEVGEGANVIWGDCYDETLGDKLSITIIATGFESKNFNEPAGTAPQSYQKKNVVFLEDDDFEQNSQKRIQGIFEPNAGEQNSNANTFEFKTSRASNARPVSGSYNNFRERKDERSTESENLQRPTESNSRAKTASFTSKLNNPQAINDLENEPAYLRRKVNLDDNLPHSSDSVAHSKWTISNDGEPEIRQNNSYLHDKAD